LNSAFVPIIHARVSPCKCISVGII